MVVPDGLGGGDASPEPDDTGEGGGDPSPEPDATGEGAGLPDAWLAGALPAAFWLLAGPAGVCPALRRTGWPRDAAARMAATPTPKTAAASMMPATSGHRRCQGSPADLDAPGGLPGSGGGTGMPQEVQKGLPGSISLPHRLQYRTFSSPAGPGGNG